MAVIHGTIFNDTILGFDGYDTIHGGAGNYGLLGEAGNDYLNGGSGVDTASYENASGPVTAALLAPDVNEGEAEGDTYISIENLTGSFFDDELTGDDAANKIVGGGDTLWGAGGRDRPFGEDGDDVLGKSDGIADVFDGGSGTDFVDYGFFEIVPSTASPPIEGLNGTNGNQKLKGGNDNDVLHGSDFNTIAASPVPDALPVTAGTYQEMADYLISGYQDPQRWPDSNITYNYQDMAQADRDMIDLALDLWDDVGNLNFINTTGSADITFTDDDVNDAWTDTVAFSLPPPPGWPWPAFDSIISAEVVVSPDWGGGVGTDLYSYRMQTFIHEIGHALGLGHQGDYNETANFPDDAEFYRDSWQLSVMSYFDQEDNTYITGSKAFVLTPQIVDIIAIQKLYGAPSSTRTGDTIYGVGNNTGRDVYGADFSDFSFPTVTIYDDGGEDTLDYSGTDQDQTIDLAADSRSSVYGETNNIIIDPGTVIENAVSGGGNDHLYGNSSANSLSGGAGNDDIDGGDGGDLLHGGDGDDFLLGYDGEDTLYGDDGSDTLFGHDGNEYLYGGDGDDDIRGLRGIDHLYGGADNDGIDGGDGDDYLYGGDGDDYLHGRDGRDYLYGDAGNDTLYGGTDNGATYGGTIYGGTGDDSIRGGDGFIDALYGDDGDDTIAGEDGNDYIYGGEGWDTISGEDGNDNLYGGEGWNTIYGGDGKDYVFWDDSGAGYLDGGAGEDWINGNGVNFGSADHFDLNAGTYTTSVYSGTLLGFEHYDNDYNSNGHEAVTGTNGDNILRTGGGNNVIRGLTGNDTIGGGGGDDNLAGGEGNDHLYGGSDNEDVPMDDDGDDRLYGGEDDDYLYGGDGRDSLDGGSGQDVLDGGDGDDILIGHEGTDTLTGGHGEDIFYWASISDFAEDVITDWVQSDDTLRFQAQDFGFRHGETLVNGVNFISSNSPSPTEETSTFLWDAGDTVLYFDPDGTGGGLTDVVANFQAGATLATDDFLFI